MKRSCALTLACMLLFIALVCDAPFLGAADELTVNGFRYASQEFGKKGLWAVMLQFNSPVFPSSVAQATKVTVDGVQKKFELLEPDSQEKVTLAIKTLLLIPTEATDRPESATITIAKGLSDAAGRRILAKDFTHQVRSYEIISVRSISPFYVSNKSKGLEISLSSSVSERDLTSAVEIYPRVENLSVHRDRGRDYFITGQFEFNKDYVLKILPKTVSQGAAILEEKEFSFKGPGIKPKITMRSTRSAIELRSRQLLPVKVSNVTTLRCKLVKIPPLVASDVCEALATSEGTKALNLGKKAGEFQKLVESSKADPVFVGKASEDAEAFLVQDGKEKEYEYSLALSFRKNPEQGGAWIVVLNDPDYRGMEETKGFIQITDLSISYKISSETLLVWVTSIYEGQPVPGAEVLLVQSDGRRYFAGKTDKNGLLKIKNRDKALSMEADKFAASAVDAPVDLAQLSWIEAVTPHDACGVRLNSVLLKPVSVTQTSKVSESPESRPNGYVFTERGVYKPGETANFKFVSRVYRDKRIVPPAGEKVNVEIIGPRSDVNYSKELTLNEFGSCWDSLQTKAFFPVGTYTINVKAKKPDGADQTFTNTFQVQEFKRIRHYAKVSAKKQEMESKAYIGLKRTEEHLAVEIQGLYYTGGPVKNGRVRWKASLVPVTNTVKGLEAFFFGNEDPRTQFLESGESVLDSQGKLQLGIPLDARLLTGISGVEISATVLDVDGEPATEVHTYNPKQRFLVGIASHPKQVQVGYAAPLKVMVVDADGKRVPSGAISASIMRGEDYDIEKRDDEGNTNYSYEQAWRNVFTSEQPVRNGESVLQLNFGEGGTYLIAFTYEDKGKKYRSQTIFKVGWDDYYTRWRSDQEERKAPDWNEVLVCMSKKEYAVGETVKIEFNTRRPVRKCLVTLERGQVFDAKVIDVNGTFGTYEFTVKEEHLPNVFVSVLGTVGRDGFPVYAIQGDRDFPAVFFGYADVSVRSEVQKLRLDIEPGVAELKGRPAEQKKLSFKVTDHKGAGLVTEMAVCVVDEAVLALTRYQTPELSSLVKFNLPLSVFSGDLRMELISQNLFRMFTTKPLTGGGMGLGEVHPSLRKDFRPVAYFNPALLTDASGRATIEFKLPDTTTAYRVFAVVCDKGSGFVSGQRNMVVTKEFFAEPSPPRFFCPGDKVVFPVVLHNKTAGKGVAKMQAKGTDTMRLEILDSSRPMEPYAGEVIKARAEIPGGMDQATFLFQGKFEGDAGTFDDAVEMTMPIHSRFLPARRVKIGDFSQKTEIVLPFPEELKALNLGDVNSSDFRANLVLSMTNWSKITPGLKYLLRYPYGCIEQTSSGVIPLAALRGLVQSGVLPGVTVDEVDKYLKQGVNRLLSMQVTSGGFAYWPGQLNPCWWGSMYAVTALTMAREAGFDVPQERMDKAVSYLREGVFRREGTGIGSGYEWTKEYALYNLAANKSLTAQELEPYLREYNSQSDQSKALLLLAANRTGALPRSKIVEMAKKLQPKIDRGRFDFRYSSFREVAICLLALTETKASQEAADSLAGQLLRSLKPDGIWYSTADTGWCLLALGKYFQGKKGEKPTTAVVKLRYGSGEPTEVQISEASAQIELDASKLVKTGRISLECDSKHLITYSLSLTYPDLVNDPAKLSQGFTLNKRIENLNGKDEIRVGDVVRVTLNVSLYDPTRTRYYQEGFQYLALEDPVPAGLVPINPALKTEGVGKKEGDTNDDSDDDSDNYGREFPPDFFEFRDDGVRVFKDKAWSGTYYYSYLARAVAEGDFWMRGSRISLMYDPDVFGRTPGMKVRILPLEK